MISQEIDEFIDRPIETVFSRIADISSYASWMPRTGIFIKSEPTTPGPVKRSSVYWDKGRFGTFQGSVEEFDAPRKITYFETLKWLGKPVWDARLEYSLEQKNGGTTVHHRAQGTGRGAMRLMEPMMSLISRGERRRTLTGLRKSFERES